MTLADTKYNVKVEGIFFRVGKGLREDDPLSTTLFNLVLEKVILDSQIQIPGTITTQ